MPRLRPRRERGVDRVYLPASRHHEAGRACVGYDRDASAVFDRVPLPLSGQRASRQLAGNCNVCGLFVVTTLLL